MSAVGQAVVEVADREADDTEEITAPALAPLTPGKLPPSLKDIAAQEQHAA